MTVNQHAKVILLRDKEMKLYPVILAGGTGSRLWPLSRETFPKQFLSFQDNVPMLQATVQRMQLLNYEMPLVICNEEHRFIVAEQLRQMTTLDSNILLEPASKNTAPAIALAAFYLNQLNESAALLVLAADHLIKNTEAFHQCIRKAESYIKANKLVTFGIVPTKPETGYGYIHCGERCQSNGYYVKAFIEKPDLVNAQNYIASGNYLWNSGMFAFKAKVYLDELKKYRPDIYEICEKSFQCIEKDMDFIRIDNSTFITCPEDSIDYAVMEKTQNSVVIPMDTGWSDIGTWSSLWEISPKDENGNVIKGDVLTVNSHNNYIFSDQSLVATVGLSEVIVVQTKDAVLVANKNQVQDIKKIVSELKKANRPEYKLHREVYRPWGKYDSISCGARYQVKRITVKPGEKLSVQMHYHRAEHWIVVMGTAKVMVDGEEKFITENQSVYIPLGAKHCLENPGKIDLELIEVQVGAYLGEDDITRFKDKYGRI